MHAEIITKPIGIGIAIGFCGMGPIGEAAYREWNHIIEFGLQQLRRFAYLSMPGLGRQTHFIWQEVD
jgi:hypothetical protein